MNWGRIIFYIGEAARPVTLLLTGLGFFIAILLPYITTEKLGAVGVVVVAFFAVKGQDKRAEIRAAGEVDKAKLQAASTDKQTAADAVNGGT